MRGTGAGWHPPGRSRVKLAAMLTAATGREFRPERVTAVQGRERSDSRSDIYRWNAISEGVMPLVLDSYSTMVDCCRFGFDYLPGETEVCARDPGDPR